MIPFSGRWGGDFNYIFVVLTLFIFRSSYLALISYYIMRVANNVLLSVRGTSLSLFLFYLFKYYAVVLYIISLLYINTLTNKYTNSFHSVYGVLIAYSVLAILFIYFCRYGHSKF